MDKLKKIISVIRNFFTSVKKAATLPKLGLKYERKRETKKETHTVELNDDVVCMKHELLHEKSNTSFSIGILVKKDDNKPLLFISINIARMLSSCKYLLATQTCCDEEPSNEEDEVWYTAAESLNNEYFSETTSETRKDEIIEQILTEVAKSLDDQSE